MVCMCLCLDCMCQVTTMQHGWLHPFLKFNVLRDYGCTSYAYVYLVVFSKVFNEGSLAVVASQDVLEEVQQQVMSYLLDERLNKLEEVAQVHRYVQMEQHSQLCTQCSYCCMASENTRYVYNIIIEWQL